MLQTAPPQSERSSERSLGELLGELTQDTVTLVRQELTLAKAEMTQKAAHVGKNIGMLAVGAMVGYTGVLALVAAVTLLLSQATGLSLWVSALIIGVLIAGIGGVLVMKAISSLKNEDLTPRQTLQSLQEIKNG